MLTINLAWTFDDGPSLYTRPLYDALVERSINSVTWFVCRNKIQDYDLLAEMQEAGSEIAIHEIHPHASNIRWLPAVENSYLNVQEALEDLRIFKSQLGAAGIRTHFVRLPGGELSEVMHALRHAGVAEKLWEEAVKIIDGRYKESICQQVANDYKLLVQGLEELGLRIWGGNPSPYPLLGGNGPYSYNSWQAECAGLAEGRGADNVTLHQAPARRLALLTEARPGRFEHTVFKAHEQHRNGSLIILAHDTTPEDVAEILADIDHIQYVAEEGLVTDGTRVHVEYCTLSALYSKLR